MRRLPCGGGDHDWNDPWQEQEGLEGVAGGDLGAEQQGRAQSHQP